MDLLSNPEMLQKISAIASGVSASQNTASQPPAAEPIPTSAPNGFENRFSSSGVNILSSMTSNSKADLLLALKPFLKETKRGKIDAVVKALAVTATLSQIKGGGAKNV